MYSQFFFIRRLGSTSRYLDDLLNIDNLYLNEIVSRMGGGGGGVLSIFLHT